MPIWLFHVCPTPIKNQSNNKDNGDDDDDDGDDDDDDDKLFNSLIH